MLTYLGPRLLFHYSLSFFVNSPSPAVVLHDYIMKLPETSLLKVYGGNVVCVHVIFFSLPHTTLLATSISHFPTAAMKFSCFSSNEIGSFVFFISYSSSFSVIQLNVDIKVLSKERIGFLVVVVLFSL